MHFSLDLDVALHGAFVEAAQRCQKFVSLEVLLLYLLSTFDVIYALAACGKSDQISRCQDELERIIRCDNKMSSPVLVEPSLEFDRVVRRAIGTSCADENTRLVIFPVEVLLSLFFETESDALKVLSSKGIEQVDVSNFFYLGVRKELDVVR